MTEKVGQTTYFMVYTVEKITPVSGMYKYIEILCLCFLTRPAEAYGQR